VVTHSLKLEVTVKENDNSGTGDCPKVPKCLNPQMRPRVSSVSGSPSNSQVGASNNTRIVGGCVVKAHSLPWQAALVTKSSHQYDFVFCGGSIICPRYVLTAAHCEVDVSKFVVAIGLHDRTKLPKRAKLHKIKKFHKHPSFGQPPSGNFDMAILELKKPITFNRKAQAIYLPPPTLTTVAADTILLVSGWGVMGYDEDDCDEDECEPCYPEKLNAVNVQIVSNDKCQEYWDGDETITENEMCAGKMTGKDSCSDDSGGPLTWLNPETDHVEQLGIVSFGSTTECGKDKPGVYARVTKGLDWIKTVAGNCNMDTCGLGRCVTGDKLDPSVQHLVVKPSF